MAKKAAARKTASIKTAGRVKKQSNSKAARKGRGWSDTDSNAANSRKKVGRRRQQVRNEIGPLGATVPARFLGG